jgi:hypothetical protein
MDRATRYQARHQVRSLCASGYGVVAQTAFGEQETWPDRL